jgi:hypothetical protein
MDRLSELAQNPDVRSGLIIVAVVIVLVALILNARREMLRRRAKLEALRARELAVMVEEVEATGFGMVCQALLGLTLLAGFASFSSAANVIQQIVIGVGMLAGLGLFGLGAALGRKRTYRIYRSEQRTDL